jgi:tetratricopeptide (TPR) repeat protein
MIKRLFLISILLISIITSCTQQDRQQSVAETGDSLSLEQLEEQLLKDSTNAQLWYQRGIIGYENGDFTSAINDFNKAIQFDSLMEEAWHDRGLSNLQFNRLDTALYDFNQTLLINPTFIEAYNNRGLLYETMGLLEKAAMDFDQCIQLNPRFAPAYFNRGALLVDINREQACVDFKAAKELGDKDAENAYLQFCNSKE